MPAPVTPGFAKPVIALPRDRRDVERFATTLARQLEAKPTLATLAPYGEALNRIDGFISASEKELELQEADWRQYGHVESHQRPPGVEDPGPVGRYYEDLAGMRSDVNELRGLIEVATAVGPKSDALKAASLVSRAQDKVYSLTEFTHYV